MDDATRKLVESIYFETVAEAFGRGDSNLTAHKEGVTAAAMMLVAMSGTEAEAAKRVVVDLGLRPEQSEDKDW